MAEKRNVYAVTLVSEHGTGIVEHQYEFHLSDLEAYHLQENLNSSISVLKENGWTNVSFVSRIKAKPNENEYRTVGIGHVIMIKHDIRPLVIQEIPEEITNE